MDGETIDPWPFKTTEVTLSCDRNRVFVTTPDGRRYGVNGTARTFAPEPRVESIQAYYDTSAVIRRGNQLCETQSGPIRIVAPARTAPPDPNRPSLKIEPRLPKGFYATVEAVEVVDGKRPKLTFECKPGEPLGLQMNFIRAPQTAPPLRGVFGNFQVDAAPAVNVELSWGMNGLWMLRGTTDQDRVGQEDRLVRAMLAGQQIRFSGPAVYLASSPITWKLAELGTDFSKVRATCGTSAM
jgi:hypothetical protein